MRICIDAGHNYEKFDTGATGNGLREQDVTFKIADYLKRMLAQHGIEVTMTRAFLTDNVGTSASSSIKERARLANTTRCDYFVSIHCNAGGGTGTETLIYGTGGQAEGMAELVNNAIVKRLGLKDRGVKVRPGLGVLRLTDMPAILVETAFIDNKNDSLLLKNGQKAFAEAIRDGILSFLGIKEPDFTEIVKGVMEKTGLEQKTMDYLLEYEYGRELVKKLFDAMK